MTFARCATCVFFSPHRPTWSDRPTGRGQCRRHAPVLDRAEDGRLRTLWPMVNEDAYCGEHAELVEEPAAEVDTYQERWVEASPLPPEPPLGGQVPTVEEVTLEWLCMNCKEVSRGLIGRHRCPYCNSREFVRAAA